MFGFYDISNAYVDLNIFSGCTSSQVNDFRAYNNVNTSGAVVLVDNCQDVQLTQVDASFNTKALTAVVGTTSPAIGILTVNNSLNITLTNCRTSSNMQTNDNNRYAPLAVLFSTNVSEIKCQSNNNSITVNTTRGFAPMHVVGGLDIVIDGCQANGNNLATASSFLRTVYVLDSPNTIITNCQVNKNSINTANAGGSLRGILLLAATTGMNDSVIRNCQVSGNSIVNGNTGSTIYGIVVQGASTFAGFEDRAVIDFCQINDNFIVSSGRFVTGIGIEVASNISVADCSCDGNSGSPVVQGIDIFSAPGAGPGSGTCRNINITNCTANDNRASNYAAGILLESVTGGAVTNVIITGCQANRNIAGLGGYGISLSDTLECSVINCHTDENSHTGLFAGPGLPPSDTAPVNRDNSIINCSAKKNGTNGFELSSSGTNDNFLLQNNVAIGNLGIGFVHSPALLTSRYLGNYASKNVGADFSIIGGAIQIFTLNASGIYGTDTGDTTHFSSLTNIRTIP